MEIPPRLAEIKFPAEWFGDETWQLTEIVNVLEETATGARMFVAGGVLTDGTNLIGLVWDGGQNLARLGRATGWALEEQIDPTAPKAARHVWRQVVEAMVKAYHDTVAEIGWTPR